MLLNYVSSLSSNKKEFESICKEELCGSNPLDYLSVSTFQTVGDNSVVFSISGPFSGLFIPAAAKPQHRYSNSHSYMTTPI